MIKNIESALQPLKALQQGMQEAARRGELTVANRIAEDARAEAPGSLGSKISVIQTEEETIIDGGDELSAYVEFGTGLNAEAYLSGQPEIVKEEAIQFFVTGKGTLKEHPFFFPAIFAHEEEIIPEVEKELIKLNA